MTANMCRKNFLPNEPIWETYSVCSFRKDAEYGSKLYDATKKCCGTAEIKGFQCWNYCAVPEDQFSTWMDCIIKETNYKAGAACQSADRSPLRTATGPPPAAYTQPRPPMDYKGPWPLMARADDPSVNSTPVAETPSASLTIRNGSVILNVTSAIAKGDSSGRSSITTGGFACISILLTGLLLL